MPVYLGCSSPGTIISHGRLEALVLDMKASHGSHPTARHISGVRYSESPRMILQATDDDFGRPKILRYANLKVANGGTGKAERLYTTVKRPSVQDYIAKHASSRFVQTDSVISYGSADGGSSVALESANVPGVIAHALGAHTLANILVLPVTPEGDAVDDTKLENIDFLCDHLHNSSFQALGLSVINVLAQFLQNDPLNEERLDYIDDTLVHIGVGLGAAAAEGHDIMNFARGSPFWVPVDVGYVNADESMIGENVELRVSKIENHEPASMRTILLRDPSAVKSFSLARKLGVILFKPKGMNRLETVNASIMKEVPKAKILASKSVDWSSNRCRVVLLADIMDLFPEILPGVRMKRDSLGYLQSWINKTIGSHYVQNPTEHADTQSHSQQNSSVPQTSNSFKDDSENH